MEKIIILISGMSATGKTTFANWISKELRIPLICYDHIKEKMLEMLSKLPNNDEIQKIFSHFPYEFFWFNCEEIMKSSSALLVDFIFSNQMKEVLDDILTKYNYTAINVHMDTRVNIAYARFLDRNISTASKSIIRPLKISFEKFSDFARQNKEFRYGNYFISVNTDDFSEVSYEKIADNIRNFIGKIGEQKV